jgi:hypothetical protein
MYAKSQAEFEHLNSRFARSSTPFGACDFMEKFQQCTISYRLEHRLGAVSGWCANCNGLDRLVLRLKTYAQFTG